MRPHKQILLVCGDEFRAAELRLVIETRMMVDVTIAYGLNIVTAVYEHDFHCAVLTFSDKEVIDFLRRKEVPTLEIGNGPSYADRVVNGSMMEILEAINIACLRKRGPRKPSTKMIYSQRRQYAKDWQQKRRAA
jgi:hypothetical protein